MRIIIAESQAVTLRALVLLLESTPNQEVIGEAKDQNALLAQVKTRRPDLVILDGELTGVQTSDLVSTLRQLDSRMGVIVMDRRAELERPVLEAGANAFVLKGAPPKRLLLAIEDVREKQKKIEESA